MKKIIFMIMLMIISIPVHATGNSFYYDDEKVKDMWIYKDNGKEQRSANPYLLKTVDDKTYVYCLEAFVLMQNGVKYTLDNNYKKSGLSKEDIDKINLIIYYGYGYGNHTSKKWYGITQYLIWKITDKDSKIYFTDKQWGDKKELYTDEINEIKRLIKVHNTIPNFLKDYTVTTNSTLEIDSNVNLNDYNIVSSAKYEIKNNKIIFSNLEVGNYNIKIVHKDNRYKNNFVLYYNKDSQNIIIPGHSPVYSKEYEFNIIVKEGEVKLIKKDSKTKEIVDGATYGIYSDNKLIKEIITTKDILSIKLPYGTYNIKEISAPKGYDIDTNNYTFTLDDNNPVSNIELNDNKLLVEFSIEKISTYNNNLLEGATYGIYQNNKLITKITTNKKGSAKTYLPYGNYELKELIAPAGYKIDNNKYKFKINGNNKLKIKLKDDKIVIKVPDTGLKENNISYTFIIIGIIGLIYGKTKYNMY